jgi:hypothetical protein
MPPAKPGEAAEVAIGRDPFAAGLDGERGEVGVGNEVSLRAGIAALALEDVPVPWAGHHGHRRRGGSTTGALDQVEDRCAVIEIDASLEATAPEDRQLGPPCAMLAPSACEGFPQRVLDDGMGHHDVKVVRAQIGPA